MSAPTRQAVRRQEEAWWAVASSTGKGWYKVVTVDGMPATCNCKGYIFRRYCRHLTELAEKMGTTVAPNTRKPVTQGRYNAGQKFVVTRPSEATEQFVKDLEASAVALGWTVYIAPQAWGAMIVAGTNGPEAAFTAHFNADGTWGGGGYQTLTGDWPITLEQLPRAIEHGGKKVEG